MKKIPFTSKFNDKTVELESTEITPRIRRDSEKYANLALQQAIADGFPLQIQLEQTLKNQGFNFDKFGVEIDRIGREIKALEISLLSGRIGEKKLTKLEGRALAIDIKKKREEVLTATSSLNAVYARTAERQADNERWQFFVYSTTVDPKTGRPFFKSFEEFKENSDTQLALDATVNFSKLISGDNKIDASYPENKWLIKYNFMNEDLHFIDSKGRLCDEDFRLVNSEGRFINENGEFIDRDGNPVDASGTLIIDTNAAYAE